MKGFELKAAESGPLFRGEGGLRADGAENSCKLYPRLALLLALCRDYAGTTGDSLEPWLGANRCTISRYLGVGADMLEDMAMSSEFLTRRITVMGGVNDLKQLIPHRGRMFCKLARHAAQKLLRPS